MPRIQGGSLLQSTKLVPLQKKNEDRGKGGLCSGVGAMGTGVGTWRVRLPERFIEPRVVEEVVKWRMTVLVSL
jgi:hypothetical protein